MSEGIRIPFRGRGREREKGFSFFRLGNLGMFCGYLNKGRWKGMIFIIIVRNVILYLFVKKEKDI